MPPVASTSTQTPLTPTTPKQTSALDEHTPTNAVKSPPPPATPQTSNVPFPSTPSSPPPQTQPVELEDGPLFRAVLASLVRRATNLRSELKTIAKGCEASLSSLKLHMVAQAAVDDSLAALSLSSSTSKSEILGGLYERVLLDARERSRVERQKEVRSLDEVLERLRGGVERLKVLETRKKAFETESKKYYDDLGKIAILDSRQFSRNSSFRVIRLEYYAFVEGLVESEESAVAAWLKDWAGISDSPDPTIVKHTAAEEARRASRDYQKDVLEKTLGSDLADILVPGEEITDMSDGMVSDDGASAGASASGGSGFSHGTGAGLGLGHTASPASMPPPGHRRRRSSAQNFGFDKEGTRDRIKGFIKTSFSNAHSSIQSALPSSSAPQHSHSQSASAESATSPKSDRGSTFSPPLAGAIFKSSPSVPSGLVAPSSPSKQQVVNGRKKEGFLWTQSRPGATAADEGSGQWNKCWTVLSEGQLIEFSNWKSQIFPRNAPINLHYANARACRPGEIDRRFCFVLTTPHQKRIYQALSQEDVTEWLSAISKSIESIINGALTHPFPDFGGSSTSFIREPSRDSTSPTPTTPSAFPHSPSGGLSQISKPRLPGWLGPPMSRRTSVGGGKKKKEKERVSLIVDQDGVLTTGRPSVTLQKPSSEVTRQAHSSSELSPTLEAPGLAPPWSPMSFSGASPPSPSLSSNEDPSDASDGASIDDMDQHIIDQVERLSTMRLPTSEEKEAQKAKNAQTIRELAELPGNTTCADCGTEDWSNEQIASMRKWGNIKANEWWECNRPAEFKATDQ
ncbi:Arf GTPase activating protein [Pseudohyphozyma bogoriensis]|nr:Arf GTPase activating protein [Pseudohyphozyma bogoriensis]